MRPVLTFIFLLSVSLSVTGASWFFVPSGVLSDNPSNVCSTNLKWWLKADELGLADNASIATIPDSSGNSYDLTATNAATFKTNIQNGLGVARFDGTNDYYRTATAASNIVGGDGSQALTMFFVQNLRGAPAQNNTGNQAYKNPGVFGDVTFAAMTMTFRGGGGSPKFIWLQYGPTIQTTVEESATVNSWNIYVLRRNGSTMSISRNGGAAVSDSGAPTDTTPSGVVQTGLSAGSSAYAQFDLAEIAICQSNLSSDNETKIRNYLNTKWAVY